ncbi:MAG: transporter [Pseudomonadales bacterium]|nr:transporter [Pseudomonadales bacterium]
MTAERAFWSAYINTQDTVTQGRLTPKVVMFFCAAVLPGAAQTAPVTFNTALPVAAGEFLLREQFLYKSVSDDPSPLDRDIDVLGAVSVLGYGVTGDLTLFGALPFFNKNLDLTLPGNDRVSRDAIGFGDARLFARYTLLQRDMPGRSFRIAPFAGMELPTGDDEDKDSLGMLPRNFQSGSGSWDPFFGVVSSYQTLDYQIDVQAGYQINTREKGFEFGDALQLDASFQYRLWPRDLGTGVPGFLYGGLEINYLHQEMNQLADSNDRDSGGETWFLSPTVQYVTRRWVLEAVVQIPVRQDLNGMAVEEDFTVRAGFRITF